MPYLNRFRTCRIVSLAALLLSVTFGQAQVAKAKKVFMITDMEGVDGIFNADLQCHPLESPRFEESRKLLTGAINADVDGMLEGGATEVVVLDGHSSGQNLSGSDIHPRARL